MTTLESITRGAMVEGVLPNQTVTAVDIKWHGTEVIELTYKDSAGSVGNVLLYRSSEPSLRVISPGPRWNFDGDGELFRLVSEARRIRLAHLFDPHLAIHTSLVQPLPHQITAVYGTLLPRQPLRFLLADDPGAGKTIMAGLLIKELLIRGDLKRCLIVCPGNLVDQWQDELYRKFQLPFDIVTNDALDAARTGNVFSEKNLLIARLDKLSRNEDVQAKLRITDWDLIVCDESHKMSATYFGGEIKYTKRYRLGQMLSGLTRHFLLMTATPHNGKEEDFQLFMALLDGDRFEGRFRDGVHTSDVSDLMRRMVKEQLLKFDGTPLFPERLAYTVSYALSDAEWRLYQAVTSYVREEFNRADALENEGRRGTVGFALTILQRRLASSPEAIYQSLKRRRERLEKRLREEELLRRGGEGRIEQTALPVTSEDLEDLDDAPENEIEDTEDQVVDQATAARTIAELRIEIGLLNELESLALAVKRSGTDRKWDELSKLLQCRAEMFDAHGHRRKLIIFTEHRDTLNYLSERIRILIGQSEAVVTMHGAMGREDRKRVEAAFTQDKDVLVLIATDAAGEGINLQRAHLMVNYDLPWNPNRIEQRFGRIHRIGQTEVCHLWNLVAQDTREGDVYLALLRKLEVERSALGGGVFDVLGKAIDGVELRRLLIEAIRYGDQPETKAKLTQVVETALDRDHLRSLLEERQLTHDTLDISRVQAIREDMERIAARRLQPHFIAAYFAEAFRLLGGTMREREPKRFEITYVPAHIRARDRIIGTGQAVLPSYERVTFEKELINLPGKPLAEYICPGHPLLESVTDIVLERYRDLLKQGAVLVDEANPSEEARLLFYLEHAITDARRSTGGERRHVSRRLQFVELGQSGALQLAGPAPYLNYRPATADELALLSPVLQSDWLQQDQEQAAVSHAIGQLVPEHLDEVRTFRDRLVSKTLAAVKERLTKEINYWDHRAEELKLQELAGHVNAKINSGKARVRADELQARLQRRLQELEEERQLFPLPPVVVGGALIIPGGLLARCKGVREAEPTLFARETARVETLAMTAVMETEQRLGFVPRDVSTIKCGYDIESRTGDGRLRFIEVKGRISGATTVTITKNEILTALNKPDDFILALVEVPNDRDNAGIDPWRVAEPDALYQAGNGCRVRYVQRPFTREPDFGVTSVNYEIAELLQRAEAPL